MNLLLVAVTGLLFQHAHAFSNTYPILTWSSHHLDTLEQLPQSFSTSAHAATVLDAIFQADHLCEHDAIVIVDQPGLHASDLRALPHESPLVRALASAPSSRQFPYIRNLSRVPLSSIAQSVSERCRAVISEIVPEDDDVSLDPASRHVIRISLPQLDGSASSRRNSFGKHEYRLLSQLNAITSSFPRYLVVLAGSPVHSKRQSPDDSPLPALRNVFDPSVSAKSSTTGVLARYQLLTPGLIIALLVVFFLLGPMVLMGVSALASIQPPQRMEAPKGYNALERKNQ